MAIKGSNGPNSSVSSTGGLPGLQGLSLSSEQEQRFSSSESNRRFLSEGGSGSPPGMKDLINFPDGGVEELDPLKWLLREGGDEFSSFASQPNVEEARRLDSMGFLRSPSDPVTGQPGQMFYPGDKDQVDKAISTPWEKSKMASWGLSSGTLFGVPVTVGMLDGVADEFGTWSRSGIEGRYRHIFDNEDFREALSDKAQDRGISFGELMKPDNKYLVKEVLDENYEMPWGESGSVEGSGHSPLSLNVGEAVVLKAGSSFLKSSYRNGVSPHRFIDPLSTVRGLSRNIPSGPSSPYAINDKVSQTRSRRLEVRDVTTASSNGSISAIGGTSGYSPHKFEVSSSGGETSLIVTARAVAPTPTNLSYIDSLPGGKGKDKDISEIAGMTLEEKIDYFKGRPGGDKYIRILRERAGEWVPEEKVPFGPLLPDDYVSDESIAKTLSGESAPTFSEIMSSPEWQDRVAMDAIDVDVEVPEGEPVSAIDVLSAEAQLAGHYYSGLQSGLKEKADRPRGFWPEAYSEHGFGSQIVESLTGPTFFSWLLNKIEPSPETGEIIDSFWEGDLAWEEFLRKLRAQNELQPFLGELATGILAPTNLIGIKLAKPGAQVVKGIKNLFSPKEILEVAEVVSDKMGFPSFTLNIDKTLLDVKKVAGQQVGAMRVADVPPVVSDPSVLAFDSILPKEVQDSIKQVRDAVDEGVAAWSTSPKEQTIGGIPKREIPEDFKAGVEVDPQLSSMGMRMERRIPLDEIPIDDVKMEVALEAEAERAMDIAGEMKKRGVDVTPDIRGEIDAAQYALGRGGKGVHSFLFDAIARRHGGKAISDVEFILDDAKQFDVDQFMVDWDAMGQYEKGIQASRDERRVLDEYNNLLFGDEIPVGQMEGMPPQGTGGVLPGRKPVYKTDFVNPERVRDNHLTGWFGENVQVDLDDLKTLPGYKGEHTRMGSEYSQEHIKNLSENMKKEGWSGGSVMIFVERDGSVVIGEGNHRVQAALNAGLTEIPAEIKYFGNSNQDPNIWGRKYIDRYSAQ